MHCPYCDSEDIQVKDSRPAEDNHAIRRRRICASCGGRFTTFERIQLRDMTVVKSDGKKQLFEREKLIRSLKLPLQKRPVEEEQIEKQANAIVRQLETTGEHEIESTYIGELVMQALAKMDTVAYIRYASVYKDFCQPEDYSTFLEEIQSIESENQQKKRAAND